MMEEKKSQALTPEEQEEQIRRSRELFAYEMTEVKLMLAGRFARVSSAQMQNSGKVAVRDAHIPAQTRELTVDAGAVQAPAVKAVETSSLAVPQIMPEAPAAAAPVMRCMAASITVPEQPSVAVPLTPMADRRLYVSVVSPTPEAPTAELPYRRQLKAYRSACSDAPSVTHTLRLNRLPHLPEASCAVDVQPPVPMTCAPKSLDAGIKQISCPGHTAAPAPNTAAALTYTAAKLETPDVTAPAVASAPLLPISVPTCMPTAMPAVLPAVQKGLQYISTACTASVEPPAVSGKTFTVKTTEPIHIVPPVASAVRVNCPTAKIATPAAALPQQTLPAAHAPRLACPTLTPQPTAAAAPALPADFFRPVAVPTAAIDKQLLPPWKKLSAAAAGEPPAPALALQSLPQQKKLASTQPAVTLAQPAMDALAPLPTLSGDRIGQPALQPLSAAVPPSAAKPIAPIAAAAVDTSALQPIEPVPMDALLRQIQATADELKPPRGLSYAEMCEMCVVKPRRLDCSSAVNDIFAALTEEYRT